MNRTIVIAASLLLALPAGLAALAPASPSAKADPELLDYLIQDVCVDAQGKAVPGDPALCSRRRNLRVGEPTPYLVRDFDSAIPGHLGYQASTSFPVRGADGGAMVMVVKNLASGFAPDFRFEFSPARDSYDLIDVSHGRFASVIRTSDGGCFDQAFAGVERPRGLAERSGGWILFPLDGAPSRWPTQASREGRTWKLQLTRDAGACANSTALGLTRWAAPATVTFETGRALKAIRSDHFASTRLGDANNALERFYFTREYGFSRWEAWLPLQRCKADLRDARCNAGQADYALLSRCAELDRAGGQTPGLMRLGGQDWVRVDCRDQTRYTPLSKPQLMLGNLARQNGLVDLE